MKNYKWLYSYETLKFDTPDGGLHSGEYAVVSDSVNDKLGTFLIDDPSGKSDFIRVKILPIGLTEIHILGSRAFDIFEDPDTKKRFKEKCGLEDYKNLALKDAGPRIKFKE